ncbi:MAG: RidA family protein [Polyangiales bacterium]
MAAPMDERVRVFSGAKWEPIVGYCRALAVGRQVWVSGTAPVDDDGGVFAPGDAYAQTRRCLDLGESALRALGGGLEHVVRTRIFVTDISRWPDVGRAHGERFGAHPPATSMVEVRRLIDDAMLVEIEFEALLDEPARTT